MTNIIDKKTIFALLKANKNHLAEYGVKKIGLFGSFAKNEQNQNSDIDLLIEFNEKEKTYRNFIQVTDLLEKILKRKIDLVTNDSLSPHIGPHIKKEVQYV